MKPVRKHNLPVNEIRRFLEPGPIVLVSSTYRGESNIMSMGWHMVMEFEPSLIGCYIWDQNHSFELIRKSRECVINIPTYHLAAKVVRIGNTSGRDVDKFAGTTAAVALKKHNDLSSYQRRWPVDRCCRDRNRVKDRRKEGVRQSWRDQPEPANRVRLS